MRIRGFHEWHTAISVFFIDYKICLKEILIFASDARMRCCCDWFLIGMLAFRKGIGGETDADGATKKRVYTLKTKKNMRFKCLVISCVIGVLSFLVSPMAEAKQIDGNQAVKIAAEFLQKKAPQRVAPQLKNGIATQGKITVKRAPVAYTAAAPEYYICSVDGGGFVIVSGDDELKPIVGYSIENTYDPDHVPVQLQGFLKSYSQGVAEFRKGNLVAAQTAGGAAVPPLLTTQWNQDEPYNAFCIGQYTNGKAVPAGCVATAMAQVMKYYNYPLRGHCVTPERWGWESLDLSQSVYDWANMRDRYESGNYTEVEANAVARLIRDCGATVEMKYGTEASGASDYYIAPAMFKYFNYSGEIAALDRRFYDSGDWMTIIRENLLRGEPIIYGASSQNSGHEFVCDGIDADNYLHINWGWSGSCDGYFDVDALAPFGAGAGSGSDTYYWDHLMIVNIRPGDPEADHSDYIRSPIAWNLAWSPYPSKNPLKKSISFSLYNNYGSDIRADAVKIIGTLYDTNKNLINDNIGESIWRYEFRSGRIVQHDLDVDFSGVADGDYWVALRWAAEKSSFPWYNTSKIYDYIADLDCTSEKYLAVTVSNGEVIVRQEEEVTDWLTIEEVHQAGAAYDIERINVDVKVHNNARRQISDCSVKVYCVPEDQWSDEMDYTQLTASGSLWINGIYGGATQTCTATLESLPVGRYRLLFVYADKPVPCTQPLYMDVVSAPTDEPFVMLSPLAAESATYSNGPYEWMSITMNYVAVDTWLWWYNQSTDLQFWAASEDDPSDEFMLFEKENVWLKKLTYACSQTFEGSPDVEWRKPGKYRYWLKCRLNVESEWTTLADANNFGYFTLKQEVPYNAYMNLVQPLVINEGKKVLPGKEFTVTGRFVAAREVTLSAERSWARIVPTPGASSGPAFCWSLEIDKCDLKAGEQCVITMRFTMPEDESLYGQRFVVKPELCFVDENGDGWQVQVCVGEYVNSMYFVYNSTEVGLDEVKPAGGKIDANRPFVVYNLQGKKVSTTLKGLARGIYLVRQGEQTFKIGIK